MQKYDWQRYLSLIDRQVETVMDKCEQGWIDMNLDLDNNQGYYKVIEQQLQKKNFNTVLIEIDMHKMR